MTTSAMGRVQVAFVVACLSNFLLVEAAQAPKPIPIISEQFVVYTNEINGDGVQVVNQTIVQDIKARKAFMAADGQMVHGHLEELTRVDIQPLGYLLMLAGPTEDPSSWSCQNSTLNSSEYSFGDFWASPPNASSGYVGVETITTKEMGTVECDRWNYWDLGEQYSFFTRVNEPTPVRTGKIFTSIPGYKLWHIDFSRFKAGVPPQTFFDPEKFCSPTNDASRAKVDATRVNIVSKRHHTSPLSLFTQA
eukprot:m.262473 g.262473  ORF g.262473 m.262473 type:complete len:249 (-) comp45766_c0_seq1:174-920(-)